MTWKISRKLKDENFIFEFIRGNISLGQTASQVSEDLGQIFKKNPK